MTKLVIFLMINLMNLGSLLSAASTSELLKLQKIADEFDYRDDVAGLETAEHQAFYIAEKFHANTRGDRMVFDKPGRSWLIPLYKDPSHHIAIMSAVQVGKSEWLHIKAITHAYNGNWIFYVMPTGTIRNDEVNNRVDRLLSSVRFYREGCRNVDNVGNKHLWEGIIRYVASNSEANFRGFPAQVFIVDENDLCDQTNLIIGQDRLSGATAMGYEEYKYFVGNPSIGGYGISERYDESDQKQWHITCPHCNKQQTVDWYRNFVDQTDENEYILRDKDYNCVCVGCSKPIDRLADGEWVAKYPDRDVSGYHISKLITYQTTIRELWSIFQKAQGNQTKLQRFVNSDLGLPFTEGDNKLDRATLIKLVREYSLPNSADMTVAGIDVGKRFHTVIWKLQDGVARTVFVGALHSPDETVKTLKRFGVYQYVIDAQPETHLARKIIEAYPGGYLCWYAGEKATAEPDKKKKEIKVDRTSTIDAMVESHQNGRIELPRDMVTLDNGDYLAHMTAPTRIVKEKVINGVRRLAYVWDEGNEPDHYFHGSNYCHVAADMVGFGEMNTDIIWLG